jgi:hypothetical protein
MKTRYPIGRASAEAENGILFPTPGIIEEARRDRGSQ